MQNTQPPPKEAMIPVYEKNYKDFWWRIHRRFDIDLSKPDKPAKSSTSRIIQVKQDFSLQDFFDKFSSSEAENEFASILFKDLLSERDVNLLLSRWRIEFEGKYRCYLKNDVHRFPAQTQIINWLCPIQFQMLQRVCQKKRRKVLHPSMPEVPRPSSFHISSKGSQVSRSPFPAVQKVLNCLKLMTYQVAISQHQI